MNKTIYVFYKILTKHNGFEHVSNYIASKRFTIPISIWNDLVKKENGDESIVLGKLDATMPMDTREHLLDGILEEWSILNSLAFDVEYTIPYTELIVIKEENTEKGMYYAHEYDQWANATRITRTYSNGHKEYEINCLNKKLIVLDGIWEEPDHSGTGDYFKLI